MKLAPFAVFAFLTSAVAACSSGGSGSSPSDGGGGDGGPPPIHAGDYDQHCAAATDCALVDDGDVCGCGGCGSAAINKGDLAKFEAEVAARLKLCPGGQHQLCPASCVFSQVTCNAGKCGVCHSPGCATPDAGTDASSDAALD